MIRLWAWAVIAAVGATSVARAEAPGASEEDRAKTIFEEGSRAYAERHYSIAVAAFTEANRLSPRTSQVIFSLAQAERQQFAIDRDPARLRHAIQLYREYLELGKAGGRQEHARHHLLDLEEQLARITASDPPPSRRGVAPSSEPPPSEKRTQLMVTSITPGARAAFGDEEPGELPLLRVVTPGSHKLRVEADGFETEVIDAVALQGNLIVVPVPLKEKPAKVEISAPEGAQVSLDGRLVGEAPLPTALDVPAGRHLVSVAQRGTYGFAQDLELGRGQSVSVAAELETTTQRTIAYVLLGAGTGAALAGGVVGGLALRAQSGAQAIEDRRSGRTPLTATDLEDYNDKLAQRDDLRPVSAVLLSAGVGALVTGALLYFIDSPRSVR